MAPAKAVGEESYNRHQSHYLWGGKPWDGRAASLRCIVSCTQLLNCCFSLQLAPFQHLQGTESVISIRLDTMVEKFKRWLINKNNTHMSNATHRTAIIIVRCCRFLSRFRERRRSRWVGGWVGGELSFDKNLIWCSPLKTNWIRCNAVWPGRSSSAMGSGVGARSAKWVWTDIFPMIDKYELEAKRQVYLWKQTGPYISPGITRISCINTGPFYCSQPPQVGKKALGLRGVSSSADKSAAISNWLQQ